MIYTCYEMIRDCRAGRPEGWEYFLSNYVPVIRRLSVHYSPGKPLAVKDLITSVCKPDSVLFQTIDPSPERQFVAELRQIVLSAVEAPAGGGAISLEEVAAAFASLTLTEKQAAWTETMGYGAAETGAMLRMAPATVENIRTRAAGLLRGQVDSWSRGMLGESGIPLGRAAAAAVTKDCIPAKAFLDVLDGRATWRGREELERHATACFHCVDHFCRLAEVLELLRGAQPLAKAEIEPLRKIAGIEKKSRGWNRWFRTS